MTQFNADDVSDALVLVVAALVVANSVDGELFDLEICDRVFKREKV